MQGGIVVLLLCAVFFIPLIGATDVNVRFHGVPRREHTLYEGPLFTCKNGEKTIPIEAVNDDYCDCLDGSDEPGTAACPNGQFYCRNKGHKAEYIPSSHVNDGICDCCDGTDEWAGLVECPNTCLEVGSGDRKAKQDQLVAIRAGAEMAETLRNEAGVKIEELKTEASAIQAKIAVQSQLVSTLRERKDAVLQLLEAKEASIGATYRDEHANDDLDLSSEDEDLSDTDFVGEEQEEGEEEPELDFSHEEEDVVPEEHEVPSHAGLIENHSDEKEVITGQIPLVHGKLPRKHLFGRRKEAELDEIERETVPSEIEKEDGDADEAEGEDPLSVDEMVDAISDESIRDGVREELGRLREGRTISFVHKHLVCRYQRVVNFFSMGRIPVKDKRCQKGRSESKRVYTSDAGSGGVWLAYRNMQSKERSNFLHDNPVLAKTLKELVSADEELDAAQESLDSLDDEIGRINSQLDADFGEGNAFFYLYKECYKKEIEKYEYEVCFYDEARQRDKGKQATGTLLGRWESLDTSARVAWFKDGERCWNGPARSVKLDLVCGTETALGHVEEPAKCEYVASFTTPVVCDVEDAAAIEAELSSLEEGE